MATAAPSDVGASIVIPTLDGGRHFGQCLEAVAGQRAPFRFEIIVIDSGSSDGTRDVARRYGARVHEIRRASFNHGLTRQWGVELAAADYVVFLTQDAVPADAHWLAALVGAVAGDDRVAGAYSRQLPRPGCDPLARHRLEHWLSGDAQRRVTEIRSWSEYRRLSPWQRRLFVNFDDVSSCVRRRVMAELPFTGVDFGEDIEWGRRVLEAGYRIVFEPSSLVYHSHPTSVRGNYRRAFFDHRSMKERFGVEFYTEMYGRSVRRLAASTLAQTRVEVRIVRAGLPPGPARWRSTLQTVAVNLAEKIACLRGAANARDRRQSGRYRIMLVSHDFPPEQYGGVAVYTHHLARQLSRRNDVHVVYHTTGNVPEYVPRTAVVEGLRVTSVKSRWQRSPSPLMVYEDRRLDGVFRKIVTTWQPDVVHFQHLGCGLSSGMVAVTRQLGIPSVLTLHDYWFLCARGQMTSSQWDLCEEAIDAQCAPCIFGSHAPLMDLMRRDRGVRIRGPLTAVSDPRRPPGGPTSPAARLRRLVAAGRRHPVAGVRRLLQQGYVAARGYGPGIAAVARRRRILGETLESVDVLLAPSEFLRRKYLEWGLRKTPLVSRYGLPNTGVPRLRRGHDGPMAFGYLGTLMATKGVHVLLDAFTRVPPSRAELRVHGYAPNEHHAEYLGLLNRRVAGAAHIRLLGAYATDTVASILEGLDVLVVPSIWWENSPLTIQEAFMAGVPVIASDLGGMAELVTHRENGLLFKAGDANDLYRVIMTVIEEPGLLGRLSRGVPRIRSIEEDAEGLERLYVELLERGQRQ